MALPLTAMKKEVNVSSFRRKVRRLILNMALDFQVQCRVSSWLCEPGVKERGPGQSYTGYSIWKL